MSRERRARSPGAYALDCAHAASLRLAAVVMEAVSRGLRAIPAPLRYRVADLIGDVVYASFGSTRRATMRQNFATMLGAAPGDPRPARLARASARNFVRMAMDFLAVRTMSAAEVLAWTRPVGEQHLTAALAERKGVIMALPHLGSWDVAAAFALAYGCPLTIVTESNWATQLVAGSRLAKGVTLVPRDRSLRTLFRTLSRNEAVVMLSDVVQPGLRTVDVPFFGRPAPFPAGPARLAQHTGAPVMVVGCTRLRDGSYRIEALPLLHADPNLPTDQAVERLTAEIAAGFERFIRAYPDQWYAFSTIWPPGPAPVEHPTVTGAHASEQAEALGDRAS